MMAGGIHVYYFRRLEKRLGLDGRCAGDALDETAWRERIPATSVGQGPEAWRKPRPFSVRRCRQCTYEDTFTVAEMSQALGHICDYILFAEAWAGFMKFHRFMRRISPWGLGLDPKAPAHRDPVTHKAVGDLSQARTSPSRDATSVAETPR